MEFKINAIYCGDCKDVLSKFPEESFDLIYLDPLFSSDRIYNIVFGTNYERRAFEDRWKGGLNYYLRYMKERLYLCQRVLKENGSIYLHWDWHASHHLRVAMDNVFGYKNFKNEIIWCYARPAAPHQKIFCRAHENILFCTKSDLWFFNPNEIRLPHKESTKKRIGYQSSAHGRRFVRETDVRGKFPEDWWIFLISDLILKKLAFWVIIRLKNRRLF